MIIAGLKRPASEMAEVTAGGGKPATTGSIPRRLAWLAPTAVALAQRRLNMLTNWAAGRALAPSSLSGVALLFGLCAAAWFSGGTNLDIGWGMIALCGWMLARVVALRLADASGGMIRGSVADGATSQDFARPSSVCALAGECAMYGGIGAGGQSAGWTGMWPLAVMTIISVALADMLVACSGAAAVGGLARAMGGNSAFWRWTGRFVAPSAGPRVMLAALGLLVHGPPVALFALLATEVASVGLVSWRLGRLAAGLAGAGRGGAGRGGAGRGGGALAGTVVGAAGPAQARHDLVVACRDDGALARWAGRLVQGNIMPLPSIWAGLGAVVLLAVLGLGNLPGVVALAPLMALLLAAPGSTHPHDGRIDWMAPVLLALSQYIYLAALGFAREVPGAVVFSLCALTAIWYANRAASAPRPSTSAGKNRLGNGLGWESRMFIVTFSAMVGIANFGYLGLAVYLGVFIFRTVVAGHLPAKVVAGHLTAKEGDGR